LAGEYAMKLMIDGIWRGNVDPTPEIDSQRMIHAGLFRSYIKATEAGRYHLYVSPACPFAHRVMIVRALK
jgi:putative glutathione S-transferase